MFLIRFVSSSAFGITYLLFLGGTLWEPARLENFLNSMILQVSVPVLSEKMYWI